ncbi:hypothetical protein [Dictyobacter kobayashii]|uniref:Uncharacterized protein n=1 Tax=Dictyobacter kobayashii TaxID=2014872 RepID=A0A402AXN5_9CHLR|nr:hypothetical protein [Dictyobacter kobayashii]GCE23900.1 hypothetical protein KDK_77000 [Dictyobacter kobayashii]
MQATSLLREQIQQAHGFLNATLEGITQSRPTGHRRVQPIRSRLLMSMLLPAKT